MSIGTFTLIRNEKEWIAAHLLRLLPFIDEMVLYDGNSKDGTIEIIEAIRKTNEHGHKIMLFKGKDPKDLAEAYTCMFDECLHSLSTDLAFFAHPDMYVSNPEELLKIRGSDAVAMTTDVRSFGGEPGGQLYEIHGRGPNWKNIYRLRNPDLGCHYYGSYGAWNEDCYFRAITGDQHYLYENLNDLPYHVSDSRLKLLHFSDVRPLDRRRNRMVRCLMNNDATEKSARAVAEKHPRVTFEDNAEYQFTPSEYPPDFVAAREKYKHLERSMELANA